MWLTMNIIPEFSLFLCFFPVEMGFHRLLKFSTRHYIPPSVSCLILLLSLWTNQCQCPLLYIIFCLLTRVWGLEEVTEFNSLLENMNSSFLFLSIDLLTHCVLVAEIQKNPSRAWVSKNEVLCYSDAWLYGQTNKMSLVYLFLFTWWKKYSL